LAGALYSSLPEAIATAQSLLDLAEEYVFRNACLQEFSKGKGSPDQIQDCDAKLEAIQSAVVITFLQNWEGNEAARRRGRTERFNTIISVFTPLPETPSFLRKGVTKADHYIE
jgi:hypothetical protein